MIRFFGALALFSRWNYIYHQWKAAVFLSNVLNYNVKSIVYKYFIVHSMRNISTLLNPFHSNILCLYKRSHRRCSIKIVFLKIQQNSAENTCARLSFKVAGLRPATLLKKRLSHRCFPVNFPKFLEQLFYRTPPDDFFLYPSKCQKTSGILTI